MYEYEHITVTSESHKDASSLGKIQKRKKNHKPNA